MTDKLKPRGKPFEPRPDVLRQEDFKWLAELAYRLDHKRGLASQMSEKLNVSEKSCLRWLDNFPPPPLDVIETTYALAEERMRYHTELMKRATKEINEAKALLSK